MEIWRDLANPYYFNSMLTIYSVLSYSHTLSYLMDPTTLWNESQFMDQGSEIQQG